MERKYNLTPQLLDLVERSALAERSKFTIIHLFDYIFDNEINCPLYDKEEFKGISVHSQQANRIYGKAQIKKKRVNCYQVAIEFLMKNDFVLQKGLKEKCEINWCPGGIFSDFRSERTVTYRGGYHAGYSSKKYVISDDAFSDVINVSVTELPSYMQSYDKKIGHDVHLYLTVSEFVNEEVQNVSSSDAENCCFSPHQPIIDNTVRVLKRLYTCLNIADIDNYSSDNNFSIRQQVVTRKMIESLQDPKVKISPNSGRLFSPFCNIQRIIRERFFRYRWCIDIKNSQYVFLAALLKQSLSIRDESTELFNRLCQAGEIYSYLGNKIEERTGKAISRDKVKTYLFVQCFDQKVLKYINSPSDQSGKMRVFKDEFPQVFEFVNTFRQQMGYSLNIHLSRMEADLFINTIANSFVDYDILTIHDALYCFDDRLDALQICDLITDQFQSKYKLSLSLDCKIMDLDNNDQHVHTYGIEKCA